HVHCLSYYSTIFYSFSFFIISFFQKDDGIRYRNVTGVQTCALPIYPQPTQRFTYYSARNAKAATDWANRCQKTPISITRTTKKPINAAIFISKFIQGGIINVSYRKTTSATS